jgi:hypothetical protein
MKSLSNALAITSKASNLPPFYDVLAISYDEWVRMTPEEMQSKLEELLDEDESYIEYWESVAKLSRAAMRLQPGETLYFWLE